MVGVCLFRYPFAMRTRVGLSEGLLSALQSRVHSDIAGSDISLIQDYLYVYERLGRYTSRFYCTLFLHAGHTTERVTWKQNTRSTGRRFFTVLWRLSPPLLTVCSGSMLSLL